MFGRSKEDSAPGSPAAPAPERLPNPPAADGWGYRSLADHRDYLLSLVPSLPPFGVGLLDAWGLTLCESIVSDLDLPTFTGARVDGWAVRGSNLVGASLERPVVLPVVDSIEAGGFRGAPLTPGTAVRVQAGAPVPEGADAVVALADGADLPGEQVEFVAEAVFHQNLNLAGSHVADGDPLLSSGTRLDARAIGLLAEVGLDKVLARPRPRVVVLTTGADLVAPGLPLTRLTHSYDATTSLIAAAARADGAQVFPIGIVEDDAKALRTALSEQLHRADLLLIVGEPSDALLRVLSSLGATDVCEVAMTPGGIQVFALVGDEKTPVLVLPPGAVPAYVTYQVFGRTLIRRLAGTDPLERRIELRPATVPVESDPHQTRFLLASVAPRGVTPELSVEDPGAVELTRANALVVVPAGGEPIAAHADATCWLLDEQPR